jgi:hypothetical protein
VKKEERQLTLMGRSGNDDGMMLRGEKKKFEVGRRKNKKLQLTGPVLSTVLDKKSMKRVLCRM